MKKIFYVICAMAALSVNAFAKGNYHGDVQFHMGLGQAETIIKETGSFNNSVVKEFDTKEICFDIATWHMWDVNQVLSFGFVLDVYGGVGEVSSFSAAGIRDYFTSDNYKDGPVYGGFLIGPALGLSLGKVAKLSLGVGVAPLILEAYKNPNQSNPLTKSSTLISSCGIGADVQLKFFPSIFFSPVIGYRCMLGINDQYTICTKTVDERYSTSDRNADYVIPMSGTLYIGFSFNW